MTTDLEERLNQILPKITGEDFLKRRGLGNEIAFFIFDYPAEDELRVRQHVKFLLEHIPKHKPKLKLAHVNLFDFLVDYLNGEGVLEESLVKQRKEGSAALLEALKGLLEEKTVAQRFKDVVKPNDQNLILISGVGSVYPLIRSHTLLNNLHPIVERTPLVMFYPGAYDEKSLRLFGRIKSDNYYRAFRLIP
ncbi:MAG: DUF1788 domain-containing protein [Planctomycetes bacterium]|nr:DUF1788 domain-containing protein [Planctomycetota bacterium]